MLHLGMNTLKGRTGLEWDAWMSGMRKGTEVGWEGRAEKTRSLPPAVLGPGESFSQAHGASPGRLQEQSVCVSTETRLGMLQAIRGNVMPQWEFRREKKKQIKGSEI